MGSGGGAPLRSGAPPKASLVVQRSATAARVDPIEASSPGGDASAEGSASRSPSSSGERTSGPASRPPGPSPALEEALERARQQGLAQDPAWLRLGHYREQAFGGWRSEADGAGFFLAANGKNDPAEELEATLRAFYAPASADPSAAPHAQCRFPARFEFLLRAVPLNPATLPRTSCPKLVEYVTRVAARSVTFTFSSYYLGNPASVFGHTFLRLNKDQAIPDGKRKELLDWGVNYAGVIDTTNPFLYALKGFFGGFRGTFSTVPYYYKVREYNDFETRDLFEYRLALTDEEVMRLVLHLWELGGTWFDYFYLDENCSYQLLAALEAAAPRLHLLEGLKPYVLPADAVKALFREKDLVVSATWRPSLRANFEWRTNGLSSDAIALVRRLEAEPGTDLPDALAPTRDAQARLLDAAVDLLDLQHARALIFKTDPAPANRRQALLVRRSRVPVASPERPPSYPIERAPEHSHGTVRLGFGGGASTETHGGFARLTLRPALHDLLDPPAGYPRTTRIEVLPIDLRYDVARREVIVEDAQLLRMANHAPANGLWPAASWHYQAGAQTLRDGGCEGDTHCLAGAMEGGLGVSASFGQEDVLLSALVDTQLAAGSKLRGLLGTRFRPSIGPRLVARWHMGRWFSTGLSASAWAHFESAPRASWSAQWEGRLHASDRFSFDVLLRRTESGLEVAGGVQSFF